MDINETVAARDSLYGGFTNVAEVSQALQDAMRLVRPEGWARLSAVQKEALTVIAEKQARIICGDPNYRDNWHDIQGYAKLAEERINGEA